MFDKDGREQVLGFYLSMSRGDIANYLRLAAETVSRVLTRSQTQQLIRVEGRELELPAPEACTRLGGVCRTIEVVRTDRRRRTRWQGLLQYSQGFYPAYHLI